MLRVALKKTRKKKVKKFAFDHCKTCSERFVIILLYGYFLRSYINIKCLKFFIIKYIYL